VAVVIASLGRGMRPLARTRSGPPGARASVSTAASGRSRRADGLRMRSRWRRRPARSPESTTRSALRANEPLTAARTPNARRQRPSWANEPPDRNIAAAWSATGPDHTQRRSTPVTRVAFLDPASLTSSRAHELHRRPLRTQVDRDTLRASGPHPSPQPDRTTTATLTDSHPPPRGEGSPAEAKRSQRATRNRTNRPLDRLQCPAWPQLAAHDQPQRPTAESFATTSVTPFRAAHPNRIPVLGGRGSIPPVEVPRRQLSRRRRATRSSGRPGGRRRRSRALARRRSGVPRAGRGR
jgi:hypothetical protein